MTGNRLVVAGLLLLALAPARAGDVFVLEDGRRLAVDAWWVEGDRILYEKYGGTIGIPRSQIVVIEAGEDGSNERPAPPPDSLGYGPPEAALLPPDTDGGLAVDPMAGFAVEALHRDLEGLEARYRLHPDQRAELAPHLAVALTLRGNDALRAGNMDAAIRDYERAVGLDPTLSPARANLAVSYLAQDRNREALAQADAILRNEPDDPDALYLRGEALYRDERMEEAIRSWERAEEIAPRERTRRRLSRALREQQVGGDYLTSAAAHFLLRYDGEHADGQLDEAILDFLEERFRAMVGRYNFLPESVVVVILYPWEEFHDVTQTSKRTGGVFDGKIRVPIGSARTLNDRVRRTLVHELTHSFIHGKTRGTCPTWLHEGLAQMEEGKRADPGTLRALAREYRSGTPRWGHQLDYAASLALTDHLVGQRGFATILDLLDRLGRGIEEDQAVRGAFGTDMDGLLRAWGEALAKGDLS